MGWTRSRRRWAWALALVLAALALAVPLTVARRQEPTPRGTPVNVRLEDFKVRQDAAVVPAGTVSFLLILGGNPVYTAPADLKFSDALGKVGLRAHVGLQIQMVGAELGVRYLLNGSVRRSGDRMRKTSPDAGSTRAAAGPAGGDRALGEPGRACDRGLPGAGGSIRRPRRRGRQRYVRG